MSILLHWLSLAQHNPAITAGVILAVLVLLVIVNFSTALSGRKG